MNINNIWFIIICFILYMIISNNLIYMNNPQNADYIEDKTFSLCEVAYYKCEDENCNCSQICKGKHYEKVHVGSEDKFYVLNHHLSPGTYCLPAGESQCNKNTTVSIYSQQGWTCFIKYPYLYTGQQGNILRACKSPYSNDNYQNGIWDKKENKKLLYIRSEDPFEKLENGEFRYECVCGVDYKNNVMKLLPNDPFTCIQDYCLAEIYNANLYGFNPITNKCECGPLKNKILHVHETPCTQNFTKHFAKRRFTGAVPCYNQYTLKNKYMFPCPNVYEIGAAESIKFTKKIIFGTYNDDLVNINKYF